MKVIILAAGYAKRLYPLTENFPKALLEIGDKPILNYILDKVEEMKLKEVVIVSNNKFFKHFEEWKTKQSYNVNIKILNDGSNSNNDRLGAIKDIQFALQKEKIDDDVLILSSDNLFEFSLTEMYKKFQELKKPLIGCYNVAWIEEAKKFGIVELNSKNKVVDFVEKPENPPSTLASIGVYFFPKNEIKLIDEYLKEDNVSDAPGNFISWLHKKTSVYGFSFDKKWFDIGSFESLEQARKEFSKRKEKEEEQAKKEQEIEVLNKHKKSGSFFDED